jgi:hypothetical protein
MTSCSHRPNVPLQLRRLMITPAADGCKRMFGGVVLLAQADRENVY